MNFLIVSAVEPFWHARDNSGSAVVADEHLFIIFVERNTLDLALQNDIV